MYKTEMKNIEFRGVIGYISHILRRDTREQRSGNMDNQT